MADKKKNEGASNKSSSKIVSNKKWSFSFLCKKDNEIVHVENSKSTFKCPTCGMTMHWDEKTRKLIAHGKTEKTIGHEMRVAKEV